MKKKTNTAKHKPVVGGDDSGDMSFSSRQIIEFVRRVELSGHALGPVIADDASRVENLIRGDSGSFRHKASLRAQQLAAQHGLAQQSQQLTDGMRWVVYIAAAIMACLGVLAVVQVLPSGQNLINVYWLLLLLLGLNGLAMVLWLLSLLFGGGGGHSYTAYNTSARSNGGLWFVVRTVFGFAARRLLSSKWVNIWLSLNFAGKLGRWRISGFVHLFWLAYLFGGLLVLLVILSSRQLDFVWGTSLLTSDVFVQLTNFLGYLPAKLGFAVPNTDQIVQSRIGNVILDPATTRHSWSGFILASLLLYGILPRIILWLWSMWRARVARTHFQPDWNDSYYIQLRARLMEFHRAMGVVDADTEPPSAEFRKAQFESGQKVPAVDVAGSAKISNDANSEYLSLPFNKLRAAQCFAYELSETQQWPIFSAARIHDLGRVSTRAQQQQCLQAIASDSSKPVVMVTMLEQAADRGVLRFCTELNSQVGSFYLLVLDSADPHYPSREQRWGSWIHLAEQLDLPGSHIVLYQLQVGAS